MMLDVTQFYDPEIEHITLKTWDANKYEGFLVQEVDVLTALRILTILRGNANPNIYLKPVVIIKKNKEDDHWINQCFDKCFDDFTVFEEAIEASEGDFSKINRWISSLPNNDGLLQDASVRFKCLRFMASRALIVRPIPTIDYKRGFLYPKLHPFFQTMDGSLEKVLEFLQSQELLNNKFNQRAYECASCDSAFLNFKETCPDCGSDQIERTELVHHFKCGNVDSLENFLVRNKLHCSKCDEDLRHIGVDYDKPSVVYKCMSCGLGFQDPSVQTVCYSCGHKSAPEDLVQRTLYDLSVSAIGENAARYGLDALFTSILQTELELFEFMEMERFLNVEKARVARYKKTVSTICFIHFENLEQVFSDLGKKTEQLFKELSAVFKAVFRETDLITARNESAFAVLMTETTIEQASFALERFKEALANLFQDSLSFSLSVHSATFDVTIVNDLTHQFNVFLSRQ